MTWSLHAAGDMLEQAEHEFVEELHKLLADPRFGAVASHFVGDFVTREVLHTAPAPTAPAVPDAAPQEQPSAPETTTPEAAPPAGQDASADTAPATQEADAGTEGSAQ